MSIEGITVILYDKIQTRTDPFNKPIYEEVPIEVENVLVSPTLSDDIVTTMNLTGKKAVYTLGIPKGDTHNWEDKKVHFFGEDWRTFGIPLQGIEALIPLDWNKKVTVERYE
jgi:hypothetical protein